MPPAREGRLAGLGPSLLARPTKLLIALGGLGHHPRPRLCRKPPEGERNHGALVPIGPDSWLVGWDVLPARPTKLLVHRVGLDIPAISVNLTVRWEDKASSLLPLCLKSHARPRRFGRETLAMSRSPTRGTGATPPK